MNYNTIILKNKTLKEYDLICPKCSSPMELKYSKFGLFYGCQDYFYNCNQTIGALKDGSPKLSIMHQIVKDGINYINVKNIIESDKIITWVTTILNIGKSNFFISKLTLNQCLLLIYSINLKIKGYNG